MEVTLAGLGDAVLELVDEYMGDVEDAAEEDVRAAAQVALDAVKASSPRRNGGYAGGWTMEPDAEDASAKAYRIHNAKKPGLTHLLEKGHGGPHPAPAHPHISAAAEAGVAELERRMNG